MLLSQTRQLYVLYGQRKKVSLLKQELGDFVAVLNPTDTIVSKTNNKKVI
jgi:hypothetical protein